MSSQKQLLLLCGGGGHEHDISITSAEFIRNQLNDFDDINVIYAEIGKDGKLRLKDQTECELRLNKTFIVDGLEQEKTVIDYVIPCIHGFPGETGDIQSFLEMANIPYLASSSEASRNCFNKITSKLWFTALGIPNTPYIFISSLEEIDKVNDFFGKHQDIFVKPASEGSSQGCFKVTRKDDIGNALTEAFKYSPHVLIEQSIKDGRELEIAVYEYEGQIRATLPGEISCPGSFYSFTEKYASNSETKTVTQAENLKSETISKIQEYSLKAFNALKLRHLSRIDFFLTKDNKIYLNEINTFPGMTSISMFPKMMEANGHSFKKFLREHI